MRTVAILAVVSLLIVTPIVSDTSDADPISLKLSAVYPTESFEGFAITNYGSPVDMKGYGVSTVLGGSQWVDVLHGHLGLNAFAQAEHSMP